MSEENVKLNMIDDFDDEFDAPETNSEPQEEPKLDSIDHNEELEKLRAENEALKLATSIKDVVVEKPISMVEKYMKELGLEDESELKDYLPILKETDRIAMEAYEAKLKLAELSKNPTIRKAQLENEAMSELAEKGNEWEQEFFEVYEHTDKLAKLSEPQKKELVDFLSSELKKVMVDRKLANKSTINPMLLIQKDITKKLKAITKTEEPKQSKPAYDPKSLMSLASAPKPQVNTQAHIPQPINVGANLTHLTSLFDIED